MKLQAEFETVKKAFAENLEKIQRYAPALKESEKYNNFETRLAFDCLGAFIGSPKMCEWYEKYNCNDTHLATLGKAVLKELKVI